MWRIFIFLISTNTLASEFKFFELRETYMNYKQFKEGARNPLIEDAGQNTELDRELSLFLNTNVLHYMYWDNQVYSLVDRDKETGKTGQFRLVGWNFKYGLRITSFLYAEYEHFSKHLLDAKYSQYRFPVEDSYGVRLYFYQKDKVNSLFW
jgi:hypothetical protein